MAERLQKGLSEERRIVSEIDFSNLEDPVVLYVKGLEKSIMKLEKPLSWQLSHNRRRSIPGMNLAREQREHQLLRTKQALKAINDSVFEEAIFYKNEKGKVVGFTIKH